MATYQVRRRLEAHTATGRRSGGVNMGPCGVSFQLIKSTIGRLPYWVLSTATNGEIHSSDRL